MKLGPVFLFVCLAGVVSAVDTDSLRASETGSKPLIVDERIPRVVRTAKILEYKPRG